MFDISKFVGGLVSPKVGLALVRNRLQAEINAALKRKNSSHVDLLIPDYRMLINTVTNSVSFIVDGATIPYNEGESMARLITSMAKEKLKPGDSLDTLLIDYKTDGPVVIHLTYQSNGEKLHKKITL